MDIVHVANGNAGVWARLCNGLWPHHSVEEMLEAFANGEYPNEYLLYHNGICVAFIGLSLRKDYVEGKEGTRPVGYIEAIYVKPQYRRQGMAKELVGFAKRWAAAQGCTMLASDCELQNEQSRAFHNKTGFVEAGINVHFKMNLG